MEELMVNFNPSLYRKYVTTNSKGKPLLYVNMHKALYGMLCSTLMFYKNIVKNLDDYGFKINEYDPCVANKTVNWSHMTVFWYMDNFKVYHKDGYYITRFATYLRDIYGASQASRSKVHNYLGMTLEYSQKGKIQV